MEGITTVGVVSVPAMATPLQTRMARRRASMAYGPRNETTPATNPQYHTPLDNLIETRWPIAGVVNAVHQ